MRQQAEVAAGIGDVLFDDQLVLGVERDLGVVALRDDGLNLGRYGMVVIDCRAALAIG